MTDQVQIQVRKLPNNYDTDDLILTIPGKKVPGLGYRAKYDHQVLGLIRCPDCGAENYVLQVSSGVCGGCGWDLNKHCEVCQNGI